MSLLLASGGINFRAAGAAPSYFTTDDGGALGATYFENNSNLPASTTDLQIQAMIYFPTGLGYANDQKIWSQESQGCELNLQGAGGIHIEIQKIEIQNGGSALSDQQVYANFPKDTWLKIEGDIDIVGGTTDMLFNDVAASGSPYTHTQTGTAFQSNREMSFLADSGGNFRLPAGVRIEYLRMARNGGAAGSYVDIDIAAGLAAVNAHAWRKGDPAI